MREEKDLGAGALFVGKSTKKIWKPESFQINIVKAGKYIYRPGLAITPGLSLLSDR
ncbi:MULTISPECIES: hypothetical protein [Dickeya]|uniref:hypothetical protein n=1 Tax=Dickeya TaxID=204037 RepID=UPI0003A555C2|nr:MULTISPECIES: hypothetical protein [Dickeya]